MSQERDGHRIAFNMAFEENNLMNGDKLMFWDGERADRQPHGSCVDHYSLLDFLSSDVLIWWCKVLQTSGGYQP